MKNTKWILSTAIGLAALFYGQEASASSCNGYSEACCESNDDSGFYIGGQVGYVNTHWDNIDQNAVDNSEIVVKKVDGPAFRPYVGYQVNQYFGVEFGWTYLSKAHFDRWNESDFENVDLTTINTQAYDASIRLSVPLFCCPAGIVARAGVCYLMSRGSIKWREEGLLSIDQSPPKHNASDFNVVFGLGVYWDFTCKLRGEVSWTRFGGHSAVNDNYQPSPDFFSIGLTYRL